MITPNSENNAVVILSDDEEEELVFNEHGKRTRHTEEGEEEEYDSEDEEDEFDQDEEFEDYHDMIERSQTLPEDHESAIFSERDAQNPYKEIDDILTEFKQLYVDTTQDDTETGFSCGFPLKDNAPDIAMNVQGVIGPITFPLCLKDIQRILSTRTYEDCFSLDTSEILLNLSFQEYLFEHLLPEIVTYLSVPSDTGKHIRLQANRFYIREPGQELKLPIPAEGAFGTMLLILPSDFSGGDIVTEYEGQEILFQPESDALSEAYYMAWYSDVETKFLPITSGHQVSIAFSLIYDGPDKSITASSLQEARIMSENGDLTSDREMQAKPLLDKITDFFRSEPIKSSQYPYFYMLNYSYTPPCMKLDQLKKSDKVVVKVLSKVAKEAEIAVYLGGIEREVEGKNEVHKEDGECPMDEEGILLTVSANYDEYILTSLMDEKGNSILKKPVAMDSKEHQPVIQGVAWYAKCKPDSEEYNSTGGDVKYWYANNTALVFVPKTCLIG